MKQTNNYLFSTLAIIIATTASILIDIDLKHWRELERVIEHDVHWYYGYLPAVFIYDDIKLEHSGRNYVNMEDGRKYYLFWPTITNDGKKIIKTTMGTAYCYAPFFFAAHLYAQHGNAPENGFSEPYKIGLLISAIVFFALGLLYVKKTLQYFGFSDVITAITLLLLGLGTNLLCYASQSGTMSHVYSFALFAIFIYYSIRWHENPNVKNTLITGLSIGLISLIRPSNVVIAFFFVLYGVSSLSDLRNKTGLFLKHYRYIILIAILAFVLWIPQFVYWKHVTGHYLLYSYTDERFFFTNPKIIDGLFSFRKGWLIYTPMMLFALIGIFLLKEHLKKIQLGIIIFVIVNIYIIFSWWCWWYGGTFGQRSLVESYALLSIPMAAFVQFIAAKKHWLRYVVFAVFGFFIWLNIFQTYQFENMALHYDGMTRKLYFMQFGKMEKVNDFYSYVDAPDYDAAKGVAPEENNNNNSINVKSEGKKITLKAYNEMYVCADQAMNDIVIANRSVAANWETFTLITHDNGTCNFSSFKSLYMSANLGDDNKIDAIRQAASQWETFTIEQISDFVIAIKADNGKYLSVDETTGQLFATAEKIGKKEKFTIQYIR